MDPLVAPTPLKTDATRWDEAAADDGYWSEASAPPAPPCAGPVEVRVRLFGSLAAEHAQQPIVVRMSSGATLGGVLAELGRVLGPARFAEVLGRRGDKRRTCRLFIDGEAVEDLSLPLCARGGRVDVEMIVLAGIEGG